VFWAKQVVQKSNVVMTVNTLLISIWFVLLAGNRDGMVKATLNLINRFQKNHCVFLPAKKSNYSESAANLITVIIICCTQL